MRDRAPVHTFIYLHLAPPRIHILQADPTTRRVRLLSPETEFAVPDSGWHGDHNFEPDGRGWRTTLHYMGDEASFWRIVRMERHLSLAEAQGGQGFQLHTYWGWHGHRRWAYCIYLGGLTVRDAYVLLNPPAPAVALAPPPPPPMAPTAAQINRDNIFLMRLRAELGLRPDAYA